MKKYLMTGVAALAICAAFTSCSKNEELFNPEQITANEAAQIVENYNKAFIATFGQPAANQDWGFGSTRTRAENKNLNEWGDPAKNGGKAWDVPDALTPEQKLRVRLYFQYNPRLTYIAPDWTDFFVQQVYKGNPATKGPNSDEEYTRVNEETITGSNEMDYLFCATETTHINDFNDGEWNHGIQVPVLNTGCSANEYDVEGKTHLDQITLMVSSSAAYIGYGASTADAFKHKDCCALAGAKAIDDWADSDEAKALNLPSLGDPVYSERWNRSFVGLDFEGLNKEDCYLDPAVTVKASDFRADNTNYVIYQGAIVSANDFNWEQELTYKGEAVKYLDDQVANKAFGEKMKVDGNQVTKSTFTKDLNKASLETQYNTTLAGNTDVRVFNFDQLLGYINEGCAPTSSDMNMIKITGARDYVYSDWIVTLTEAKKVDEDEPEWDIRIIAEDLNAQAADSKATDDWSVGSDWDFNDVVFDVKFTSNTTANVKIIGAGGVYPLYVAGHEAHKALGQAGPDSNGRYQIQNSGNAEPFPVSGIDKANNGRDIVVTVVRTSSTGEEIISELKAEVGKPAAKIGVNPKFKPCAERYDIRKQYPLFSQWVQGNITGAWYTIED